MQCTSNCAHIHIQDEIAELEIGMNQIDDVVVYCLQDCKNVLSIS